MVTSIQCWDSLSIPFEGSPRIRRTCSTLAPTGKPVQGQRDEKGPSVASAPSVARSTYRKYASRATFRRRLPAGPFSSRWRVRLNYYGSVSVTSFDGVLSFGRRASSSAVTVYRYVAPGRTSRSVKVVVPAGVVPMRLGGADPVAR